MKIAYITSYLGTKFLQRYSNGKKFALSGVYKSQGIARALMKSGHSVIIYSPGITSCNTTIPSFEEIENYPEGSLKIKYCNILSKRKRGPVNDFRIIKTLKRDDYLIHFDIILFYNINIASALAVSMFDNRINILEYEDNLYCSLRPDGRISFRYLKDIFYNYVTARSHGLLAVSNGIYNATQISHKVLTPGILNEDAIHAASRDIKMLDDFRPVNIILIGGVYFAKGPDLLLEALCFIKRSCHVIIYSNEQIMDGAFEIINTLPKNHQVSIRGFLPHGELMQVINSEADILINTTRNMGVGKNMAGFPFKMMEYASTGRPIVSSEIGKLDSDFNKYITYYEHENPKSVAIAINEVIDNYEYKTLLAKNLQKKVLIEYTIEGTAKKIESLIHDIFNEDHSKY